MADLRTKYWFDTEFIEDGKTIDLISIGIVCEDGRMFYAENLDCDITKASDWVKENVLPHLWAGNRQRIIDGNKWSRESNHFGGLMKKNNLAREIRIFVANGDYPPEFWTYFGAYDWVVLMQLYGTMMDKPDAWPYGPMDIQQLVVQQGGVVLPEQNGPVHNALSDAIWTKEAWEWLTSERIVADGIW